LYSQIRGRYRLATQISGYAWEEMGSNSYNAVRIKQEDGTQGEVEDNDPFCGDSVKPYPPQSTIESAVHFNARLRGHYQVGQGCGTQYTVEAIHKWLEKHLIIPDHDITTSPLWLKGPFLYITERYHKFQSALKVFKNILSTYTLSEPIELT
jgi:hypothetical protein